MTVAVVLVFATCIVGGTGLTMFNGLSMRAEERFFAGWILGIVAFTICGIISTRLFSFNGFAVAIASAALLSLSGFGWKRGYVQFQHELRDLAARARIADSQNPLVALAFIVVVWIAVGRIFFFAYHGTPNGGLMSGHLASWTDWQAHLAYTASFAYAENTAMNLPLAAGYDLGYHAGINYFAALLIPAGATLPGALQLSSAFTIFAFPGVMITVGYRIFSKQTIGILGTALFMFFGGWSWYTEFRDDLEQGGLKVLANLPRTYTRAPDYTEGSWVIENPIVGHFFPQRPTLIGFPVLLLILGWAYSGWRAMARASSTQNHTATRAGSLSKVIAASRGQTNDASSIFYEPDTRVGQYNSTVLRTEFQLESLDPKKTLLFCGILTGVIPFFNLFAFGASLVFVGCWWLMTRFRREWLWLLAPAVLLALPVVGYMRPPSSSFEIPYDWVGRTLKKDERGELDLTKEWFKFWARQMGLFLPLLIAAMAWPKVLSRPLAVGLLPLWLFFVVPNFVKPHPWDGNNTHYFVLVILIGALPVAALLVSWLAWRRWTVLLIIPAFLTMTLAGTLDVIAAADREAAGFPVLAMDGPAVAVGEWARTTETDSVFAIELDFAEHAAFAHLHPIPALSGRDVVTASAGWVYDLGIPDWHIRRDHSRLILEAAPGHEGFIEAYGVDYVVIGPNHIGTSWSANIDYWRTHGKVVYDHAGWSVYKV